MRRDWIGTSSCFIELSCALGIALAALPVQATGQESSEQRGHITIQRNVPQHDAFRVGDKGKPVNIATSREDIVISTVTATHGVPQALSDAMLNDVGSAGTANSGFTKSIGRAQGAVASAVAGSGLIKPNGGAASAMEANFSQASGAGVGAAISRSMAPIGSIISAMPGAK